LLSISNRTARRVLSAITLSALALGLAACSKLPFTGGGNSSGGGGGGSNFAPAIVGTPSTDATVNTRYTFTPDAYDPEGDALRFSIRGKPSWASFNASTGELSGTPTTSAVGAYAGIRISVTDGVATTALPDFSIVVSATAGGSIPGSAQLTWAAPGQNVDGTKLTDLAGYRIYYGQSPTGLLQVLEITNPATVTAVVPNLVPGTWYFAISAYSAGGAESARTTTVSKTI
jgi:hypothetical protein